MSVVLSALAVYNVNTLYFNARSFPEKSAKTGHLPTIKTQCPNQLSCSPIWCIQSPQILLNLVTEKNPEFYDDFKSVELFENNTPNKLFCQQLLTNSNKSFNETPMCLQGPNSWT